MKQRSTTPVSLSFTAKACLVAAAILGAVATPISVLTSTASADKYDDQINAIQRQIDQYEAEAGKLRNQANDLQQKISGLTLQIQQIQGQIDISQAKYDQLQVQITETENDITTNKQVLGDSLTELAISDEITPIEMLAGSKNVSEYVDKSTQNEALSKNITKTLDKIQELKKQLEQQKKDVTKVLADQKNARSALDQTKAEQAQLLAQTQGQQASYERLSSEQRAQQDKIRQQQQAEIAARFASSGGANVISSGAAPDYPWNAGNCPMVGYYSTRGADGNGGDGKGYGCRQCVSYVAWRMARETGRYPMYWGNATNVPASARAAGIATGYTPRAGAMAVMHPGTSGNPEGHVGWVEAVLGNGQIVISQYNYNYGAGYGMYSKMTMSASAWDEYVYVK